jgi:hypothetical protein
MISRTSNPPATCFEAADGLVLPILDLTDPRFRVPTDAASMARLRRRFARDDRLRRLIPNTIQRALLRRGGESRLVAALLDPIDHYDGICTYVIKLGSDNLLPPFDKPGDRRLTDSAHATCVRLRMQMMAQLMADEILADATFSGSAPLHLINIGGGPSFDSINALLMIGQARPALLDRPITIHILDQNDTGAPLCHAAVQALSARGKPFEKLAITVDYQRYDWNDPRPLAGLTADIAAHGGVALASSEGALFEYGDDAAIVANLDALRPVLFIVGSVTADRPTVATAWFDVKRRGVAGITPLVAAAGYDLVRSEDAEMSHQILLRRSARPNTPPANGAGA